MIVRPGGAIIGTIGGGVLEARVQQMARQVLTSRVSLVEEFNLTAEEAGNMGMICGGGLRVLIQYVDASDPSNLMLYKAVADVPAKRRRSWLATSVPANGSSPEVPQQWLVSSDGLVAAGLGPKEPAHVSSLMRVRQPEIIELGGETFFVEPLWGESIVYIFGAGHVSQKLAPLTRMVGFRTVVLDDRSEYANRKLFESADEIIVPDSFETAMEGLAIDEESYLVLVTRGHSHDKTRLRQALGTRAGYIGMIGSRRKRDGIYADLTREGFDSSHFKRVHSPIGLSIGAETPEEIAVSIVAELIEARTGRDK
jgi:xanthine dehydrogenase accessory factor